MTPLLFLNIGGPELIMLLIIGLLPMILVVYCLVDVLRSEFKDSTTKLVWLLVILFVPALGSVLYLMLGRQQKIS